MTRIKLRVFKAMSIVILYVASVASATEPKNAELQSRISEATDSVATLRQQGRYTNAADIARKLLEALKTDAGARPYQIADAERLLSTLQFISGLVEPSRLALAGSDRDQIKWKRLYEAAEYDSARVIAEHVLQVQQNVLGIEHSEVAIAQRCLARTLQRQSNYAPADSLYDRALAMQKKLLGDEHPEIATTLNDIGTLYLDEGKLADSEPILRQALAMRQACLGKEHSDVAIALIDLGHLLENEGHYGEAETLDRQAITMLRRLSRDDSPQLATALNNLGVLLMKRGDLSGAEPLCRESVSIRRRLLAENHPDLAMAINNLASVLYLKGDYIAAEPLLRQALAMKRTRLSKDHPSIAMGLLNLSALSWKRGDLDAAQELLEDALWTYQQNPRTDPQKVARVLNNLGQILLEKEEYADALAKQERALALYREALGNDHENVATVLGNIAATQMQQGNYARAEELLRDALGIYQRRFPLGHPSTARCLSSLGRSFMRDGDYAAAMPVLMDALSMYIRVVGEKHPEIVPVMVELARLSVHRNDFARAESLLVEATEVFEAARGRVAVQELGRVAYTSTESPYPLLAETQLKLKKNDEAWQATERDRGRCLLDMLKTKALRRLTIEEIEHEKRLQERLTRLENSTVALALDTTRGSAQKADSVRTLLLTAQADWLEFERGMADKYPVTEGGTYPLKRIQSSLNPRSAIIGWLDVEDCHLAYLIRQRGPVMWSVISSSVSDSITDEYRNVLVSAGEHPERRNELARLIYSDRLAPFEEQLQELEELYVIPSGPMVGIPVEPLLIDDSTFAEDRWNISYTPSATVLAWLSEEPEPQTTKSLFALADPPFNDEQAIAMGSIRRSGESAEGNGQHEWKDLNRSVTGGNRTAMRHLDRLEGTRREVNEISNMFASPKVLLGSAASEENVVDLAQHEELAQFRYVHLATHAIIDERNVGRSSLMLSQVNLPDPTQSAISGDRMFDGRLTMEEVLREWHLNADLVTLSACETALGRRTRGEGYIGFAHAFFRAGAKSVVVSLWKVSDQATRRLMVRFYDNMINRGMTKSSALRDAKSWLRTSTARDGKKPFADPAIWSAFILVGDSD